jgi:hypothetical protein
MPVKITPGTNPLGYLARDERAWRLQRVFAQDGLNPTQVVRYFEAPEGIDFAEASELPFKIDATANADDGTNTSNVTTDDRRYVVNPHVLKHQFDGLWTGGPARWGTDQQTQKRTVEQTLTRTFPAGHGYLVDADGNYVVVWKDATGNGFHRDGPNGTQIAVESTDVCEYATAKAALMSHRPSLTSRFSPYMALREDIPGSYWREIVWRDFTHESIPFIEALKDSPADVQDIVEYHFGSRVAGDVQDLTANVDKETNTVYVKCSLLLRDLAEPTTPAELVALPHVEAPCTRETLRIFGFNFLADGEGYKFTHVYRWPGLKDSATTRALLEWVNDSTLLPLLRAADYEAETPSLEPSEDGTGRFYTYQVQIAGGPGNPPDPPPVKCKVPWWRILKQEVDGDRQEDGSLAYTVIIVKPEWHGSETKPHVQTAVDNPWFGTIERKVIPSVPRDDAERVLAGVDPGAAYRKLAAKRSSEDPEGRSDITYEGRTTYDYLGGVDGQGNPDGHTPPAVILGPAGNIFNAPEYDYDPERKLYRLGWTYVEPSKLDDLIAFATARLGGNPEIRTQYHEGGYFTLRITGRGKEPEHVAEWMVAADWFKHETLEIWRGVTVEMDAAGVPTGFYTEYEKNADGTYKTDQQGHLIPIGGLVPFYTIRGDLDANWMGSDAQGYVDPEESSSDSSSRPVGSATLLATTGMDHGDLDANWMGSDAQGYVDPEESSSDSSSRPAGSATLWATTGMDHGGNGGPGDGKELLPPDDHDDHHGNGWNQANSEWTDPDGDSPGNAGDKKRLHSLTRVSPRKNEDGSYDVTITRVYPHQRYWTWTTTQENAEGETRDARHFAYRNWPSRKAIETDIIDKIKALVEESGEDPETWDDGWALTGGVAVNEYGLVDAPNLTLVPSWDNDKDHIKAKGGTSTALEKLVCIERAYSPPAQFISAGTPPTEGFWWRKVYKWIYTGTTWTERRATLGMNQLGGPLEGSRGIETVPSTSSTMKHWKWHVVVKIEYDSWQAGALPVIQQGGWYKTKSEMMTPEDL